MKRIATFAASHFSATLNPRCLGYATLLLLMIINSSDTTNAQSRERGKPTPLTSNEISGVINGDTRGNTYYYSFMTGPGEVSITLILEPGQKRGSAMVPVQSVKFTLFDSHTAETLASESVSQYAGGDPTRKVVRVEAPRRQSMILSVNIPGGYINEGVGKYRVLIGGAANIRDTQSTGSLDASLARSLGRAPASDIDNPECLPKKGILRVRMKDGSIRRIDLSQSEEITITP